MRGTDPHGNLVPAVVGEAVGEHLSVGALPTGAVVQPDLAAWTTALQLQEPGRGEDQGKCSLIKTFQCWEV